MFIEGVSVKNFHVDKLYCHGGDPSNIWLNDNVDTWLSEDDAKVFGKFVKNKYNTWVKVIQNSKLDKNGTSYQACYLCVEVKTDLEYETFRNYIKGFDSQYGWRELTLFPGMQDVYYDEIVTYQDK